MKKHDTVETLQQQVEIPEIVQRKADLMFDKIRMEQEASDTTDNQKRVTKFPKKRIALVAAIAVLAVATVTVAAAYLKWSDGLSDGLQATEEQKAHLEETQMATFVNQVCEEQGITITAVQTITDNYYTHIAFKVEGYEVEGNEQPDFEEINVLVDGEKVSWNGSFYDGLVSGLDGSAVHATDGSPVTFDENGCMDVSYVMDDGSMEFELTLMDTYKSGAFIGKPIQVEFNNLGTVAKAEYTNKITGNWSFDWELKGSGEMKEWVLNQPLGDSGATVSKAEISPISIRAEYEFAREEVMEPEIDEDGSEIMVKSYVEPPELRGVKMKDGTLYPNLYLGPGNIGYEEASEHYVIAYAIERILDVNQVEGLLFAKDSPYEGGDVTEDDFYVVPLD